MRLQIIYLILLLGVLPVFGQDLFIISVTGKIPSTQTGVCLSHEHLLVDFIGAKEYSRQRWIEDDVFKKVLPFLLEAKANNVQTFFDCTPNYLGRDAQLLTRLSKASGINIVTNTGLYGGSDNKYLPDYAFTESAEQLAQRWVDEFKNGIDGSDVRPGFIKISVSPGPLTEISKKLITAAAITHKATGLTIASHTGPYIPAKEELDILNQQGIKPDAFIWVHAQNENQTEKFTEMAKAGAWVSLDGVNENSIDRYVEILNALREEKLLNRVLLSQDAGWYDPAKPDGGEFRSFNLIFEKMLPALKAAGFSQAEIDQLITTNPATAYSISKRLR